MNKHTPAPWRAEIGNPYNVVQLGTGVWGLTDRFLGGLAPLGLLPFDYLLTFGLGGACLLGAVLPHAERNIWETEPLTSPR